MTEPRKKEVEADDAPGAPDWMVTFSDCMTLLLTFFVLLLSFSSFDERVFWKLKSIFSGGFPSVSPDFRKDKDAFLPTDQITPTTELDAGSEKPTLSRGGGNNLKEDTEPGDFRSRKVFLISSQKIFWGKGAVISSQGRRILSAMASFLKEVAGRIVISEDGPADEEGGEEFGLARAWSAMEYMTSKHGLDKKRLSLSASSTTAQENLRDDALNRREAEAERVLEIVLLERSIYN